MTNLRILITGACGVTSRSVVRSLLMSDKFKDSVFIGTDICENLFGLYEGLYRKVYRVPKFNDNTYKKSIETIIEKEKINVAIVIPELEVLFWIENPFKVKVFLPPLNFSKRVISKKTLYEALHGSKLIPKFAIIDPKQISESSFRLPFPYPVWIRDYAPGTTSGKGAFLASEKNELESWIEINKSGKAQMISEYLPGRNFGCFFLFHNDRLLKSGIAERIHYLMGKVAISGITGNTSRGKLTNNSFVKDIALNGVKRVCQLTGEKMNGLVVVDLKENDKGMPVITEINIRHVAFTSSFAQAGFNFSEFHLLCALGRFDEINNMIEMKYPINNLILRDVDGSPIYVKNYKKINMGKSI